MSVDPSAVTSLARLMQGTARDLLTLQVALADRAVRSKGLPVLAWTTCYHVLRPDWFAQTAAGIHGSPVWNFTVLPETMLALVRALGRLGDHPPGAGGQARTALALVLRESRLGAVTVDTPLDEAQTAWAYGALRDALRPDDGLGRELLDRHCGLLLGRG
jgi:hypothetical protein